jgi:N-acetylneuraminic acid mutarotase
MNFKKLPLLTLLIIFFACSKNNSTSNPNTSNPTLPPVISGFSPLNAPVDSLVTITGSNFSTDITKDIVKFNGNVAVVKSATETQLIVVVPAGVSSGKITVTVGSNTAMSTADFSPGDHWMIKASFPGSFVGNITSFNIGNNIYLGLGEGGTPGTQPAWLHEFWQYDAATDVWTQKADYPDVPTGFGLGFSIGGKGYVVMNPDSVGASVWQYDTASNTWTRKADYPSYPQSGTVAFSVNNRGYVVMGTYKDVWQYDPAVDLWTHKGNFPGSSQVNAATFVIGNYAYLGTGMNGLNTPTGSTDFYQYDPTSDTWTKKTNFPGVGRNSASGFAIGAYGYLGTGYDQNGYYLSDFWRYDPSSDSWTRKQDFGGGVRSEASPFSGTSQGYLGFGNGQAHQVAQNIFSSNYIDMWQYQP